MTTPQRPIDSGFDQHSTAADVLAGIDLTGRLAVVTGGYSGLGLETVRALSGAGATVIVPARRPAAAAEALADVPRTEVGELDLADLDSVHAFAARLLERGDAIDFLINNAAIMACPETRVGPGWEAQFATNHLGHFALTNLLWPALAADGGARVVALSSRGHRRSPIRWDDLQFEHGYDKWEAYGQAKTANVLFAVAARRARQGQRRARVRGPSGRHPDAAAAPPDARGDGRLRLDRRGRQSDASSSRRRSRARRPRRWAATAPLLDGIGGVYCEDCDIAEPASAEDETRGVAPYAVDPDEATRLWTVSARSRRRRATTDRLGFDRTAPRPTCSRAST